MKTPMIRAIIAVERDSRHYLPITIERVWILYPPPTAAEGSGGHGAVICEAQMGVLRHSSSGISRCSVPQAINRFPRGVDRLA